MDGFSLQLFTTRSSHCSCATTLGTLMHCFCGFKVHFWVARVLHWWEAVLPWQLAFETKLHTLSFFGWQPYSAKGGHCLVTYLHSFTCDFGQSLDMKPMKHICSWCSLQCGSLNSMHSSVASTDTTVLQTETVSGLHSTCLIFAQTCSGFGWLHLWVSMLRHCSPSPLPEPRVLDAANSVSTQLVWSALMQISFCSISQSTSS